MKIKETQSIFYNFHYYLSKSNWIFNYFYLHNKQFHFSGELTVFEKNYHSKTICRSCLVFKLTDFTYQDFFLLAITTNDTSTIAIQESCIWILWKGTKTEDLQLHFLTTSQKQKQLWEFKSTVMIFASIRESEKFLN